MTERAKAVSSGLTVALVGVALEAIIDQRVPSVGSMVSFIVAGALAGWLLYVGKYKGHSG